MMKIAKISGCRAAAMCLSIFGALLLGACAVPQAIPVQMNSDALNVAPDLSPYVRFDLVSQASGASGEQKAGGALMYRPGSASFDVIANDKQAIGRLAIQPEACRDDPAPDCQRRFVLTGRLSVLNASINCYVPVRNDTGVGYAGQTLAGICQDRYGRSFSISIYAQ